MAVPTMQPNGTIVPTVGTRRFAVLGAGFAGVSVAWHLLQHTSLLQPICVDLFDETGVGGGASGASGGLLHPFNPKGKLLWKGADGWTAALRLLAVAEGARCRISNSGISSLESQPPLAWRRGILRLARREKDALTFKKNVEIQNNRLEIDCLARSAVTSLVPGLELPEDGLALHIPQGINIHPQRYLQALWFACEDFARQAVKLGSHGTEANLRREKITSLYDLTGSYEAVVVCLGAQALLLPELAEKLPLSTCRGVVVKLQSPQKSSEKLLNETPNLLSSTWIAIQEQGSVLLGATKDWGSTNTASSVSDSERDVALAHLFTETGRFFPSISDWEVKGLQAGLRAMPPRTEIGSTPLAGCIDGLLDRFQRTGSTKWWFLGGLGSRGLIHHGWLGAEMAKAVLLRNDSSLPLELRQWTLRKAKGSVNR